MISTLNGCEKPQKKRKTDGNILNLELMLKATNQLCPTGLYNQCVSLQNEKLFFIGMADQFYTFTMFQLQVIMNAKIYHDFVSIESLF